MGSDLSVGTETGKAGWQTIQTGLLVLQTVAMTLLDLVSLGHHCFVNPFIQRLARNMICQGDTRFPGTVPAVKSGVCRQAEFLVVTPSWTLAGSTLATGPTESRPGASLT